MKTAITNLFGVGSTTAEANVSWARERSGRELRQFVNQRHSRLDIVDLAFDEL